MSLPQHLYIRPLTIYDLDQCLKLEADGFPPNERCSAEKFEYRLTVCPELCSGLFLREFELRDKNKNEDDEEDDDSELNYYHNSRFVKETLIGHVIATKISDDVITDRSMDMPKFVKDAGKAFIVDESIAGNNEIGHCETSSVVGVHSVVIHSDYKKLGLGTLILKDYIQKLSQQEVGDKIVIIAHDRLVPFYKRIGFIDQGVSDCKFGGETWNDLYLPLIKEDQDD